MIHPDDHHLLHDWVIYGPKNEEIGNLVEALAKRGLRVEAIEDAIAAFLRERLRNLDMPQPEKSGQAG
jgi:hypothetical protein